MINQTRFSNQLALDPKSTADLKGAAGPDSPEALKGAARQFEALFLSMMLKSMRDATPRDGVFDSEQHRMYTAMLDQQLSQSMASRGVGLADVLVRQLSANRPDRQMPGTSADERLLQELQHKPDRPVEGSEPASGADPQLSPTSRRRTRAAQAPHVQSFRERLSAHAEAASRETGIPAKFILGQAALESGWGRHEITGREGVRSHNLFGIKAGSGWKGRVVEAVTTEYVNGVARRKVEKFRAYDSYTEAFRDYARLLGKNPRYQSVIAHARDAVGFAREMQRAGYATDPQYAAKLTRIIQNNLA